LKLGAASAIEAAAAMDPPLKFVSRPDLCAAVTAALRRLHKRSPLDLYTFRPLDLSRPL